MDRLSNWTLCAIVLCASGCAVTQQILPPSLQGPTSPIGCGEPQCELHEKNDSACCGEMICGNSMCVEGCGASSSQLIQGKSPSGLTGGIEYGRDNIFMDSAGWIVGIPSKLLLWNTKVDSHHVSPEVISQVQRYLDQHGLDDVKVRINQYNPLDEYRRLRDNRAIHPAIRYSLGSIAMARYTLAPGRLFGADKYNPFTNTISLYSDRASLALREAAKAANVRDSEHRDLHAASMQLPGSPLWIDYWATRDVIEWAKETRQRRLERESYLVLFPAYGDNFARSLTGFLDVGQGQAIRGSLALVGHAVGRTMALRVSQGPVEIVKTLNGIVRKPEPENAAPTVVQEPQSPAPLPSIYPVSFEIQPLDVSYVPTDWRR